MPELRRQLWVRLRLCAVDEVGLADGASGCLEHLAGDRAVLMGKPCRDRGHHLGRLPRCLVALAVLRREHRPQCQGVGVGRDDVRHRLGGQAHPRGARADVDEPPVVPGGHCTTIRSRAVALGHGVAVAHGLAAGPLMPGAARTTARARGCCPRRSRAPLVHRNETRPCSSVLHGDAWNDSVPGADARTTLSQAHMVPEQVGGQTARLRAAPTAASVRK